MENLQVVYHSPRGQVAAVRGISLSVAAGEKVGIVGESGSGKTSVGMAIPNLLGRTGRIAAGAVFIGDRDVTHLSDRKLSEVRARQVSVIFQDPLNALDPIRTVYHQVAEAVSFRRGGSGRSRKKEMRLTVRSLLDDCEIAESERVMTQYPHEISGGMRQRVMIAIALAGDCRLLVADEPTTALDVTTQAQIMRLLNRLVNERQIAVVLITHNLALVSGFCDRVVVVYGGRVVEEGNAWDIVTAPLHPYTKALVGSIPTMGQFRERLTAISGMPPDLRTPDSGCAFEPRCSLGHGVAVCQTLMPKLERRDGLDPGRLVRCHLVENPRPPAGSATATMSSDVAVDDGR
jgi:oligopeptide/dipeptide ABC transporter ATP-binding protein